MQVGIVQQFTSNPAPVESGGTKEIILLLRQINEKLDAIVAAQQSSGVLNVVSPEKFSKYLSEPETRERLIESFRGKERDKQ